VRLNIAGVKEYECVMKHLLCCRELLVEHVARVARHIIEEEKTEDLQLKMDVVAVALSDVEELLLEFVQKFIFSNGDVATASAIRFDREEFRRFLEEVGHMAAGEEHLADKIKAVCKKLQETEKSEVKKKLREVINELTKFLDATRLCRQKFINGFLERGSLEQRKEEA